MNDAEICLEQPNCLFPLSWSSRCNKQHLSSDLATLGLVYRFLHGAAFRKWHHMHHGYYFQKRRAAINPETNTPSSQHCGRLGCQPLRQICLFVIEVSVNGFAGYFAYLYLLISTVFKFMNMYCMQYACTSEYMQSNGIIIPSSDWIAQPLRSSWVSYCQWPLDSKELAKALYLSNENQIQESRTNQVDS